MEKITKDDILNQIYEYLLEEVEKKGKLDPLNLALKKVGDLICMEDEVIEKRLKYEPRTNAAYVYFRDGHKIKVASSNVFRGKVKGDEGEQVIIMDHDKNGDLIGLEVLFVIRKI